MFSEEITSKLASSMRSRPLAHSIGNNAVGLLTNGAISYGGYRLYQNNKDNNSSSGSIKRALGVGIGLLHGAAAAQNGFNLLRNATASGRLANINSVNRQADFLTNHTFDTLYRGNTTTSSMGMSSDDIMDMF
jgi:hypothetical protein